MGKINSKTFLNNFDFSLDYVIVKAETLNVATSDWTVFPKKKCLPLLSFRSQS